MKIEHPLWDCSILGLKATWLGEDEMRHEVADFIRARKRCDDLTKGEESFIAALQDWLRQSG